MRRLICVALVWMCALGGAWGCASSGGTKGLVRQSSFTKPEELAKISAKSTSTSVLQDDGLQVATWTLSGPLPTQIGLQGIQGAQNKFEGALLQAVAGGSNKQLRATEAMRCAARQMGEFALAHELALPSQAIRDFIRQRCGAVSAGLHGYYYTWDMDDGVTLEIDRLGDEFFKKMIENIEENFEDAGPTEIGVWFGQVGNKAILQLSTGRRRVDVETLSMVPASGDRLVIRGELLQRANRVRAMITHGDYDSEECVMDSSVKLPKFRAVCPISMADQRALFAIYDSREDSIFSSQIFDQLIWPNGQVGEQYMASTLRQKLEMVDVSGKSSEQAYLAYINAIRADAGVNPLVFNEPQTRAVQALTPHMFEANGQGDEREASKIAMGLMAGWEITENVVDADFQMHSVSDGDLISLIESCIASPSGRKTLLSEDGNSFALGEVREGDNLGAMLLVYDYLPEETYIRRLARGWRTINKARELTGKKPIKRSKKGLKRSQEIARKMAEGVMSYEKGVDALMESTMASYDSGVMAYTTFTHDLDDFELSEDIMQARGAEAVLMVTPLDVPDYPWTIYAVVMVVPTNRFKK